MSEQTLSIVIPLFKSEADLPPLFAELERVTALAPIAVEIVFVDDGSPDRCGAIVERKLETWPLPAQLIRLSRNFGSFAAITAGLAHAKGDYCAVLAADLQEPPELALEFLDPMRRDEADVVFGQRTGRGDPAVSRLASNAFWGLYRRMVNPEIPSGGVDVFACNRKVRDQICSMKEVETSLPALLFWVGYRRAFVPYQRRRRERGGSAWTFGKKMRYLVNSVFSFTDLPIRVLLGVGVLGMALALLGAVTVLAAKTSGRIGVPGYSATVLAIFFFGGLTSAGLGIVGQYLWLCLQNTRGRPLFIVSSTKTTGGSTGPSDPLSPRPPSTTPNPDA